MSLFMFVNQLEPTRGQASDTKSEEDDLLSITAKEGGKLHKFPLAHFVVVLECHELSLDIWRLCIDVQIMRLDWPPWFVENNVANSLFPWEEMTSFFIAISGSKRNLKEIYVTKELKKNDFWLEVQYFFALMRLYLEFEYKYRRGNAWDNILSSQCHC